METIRNASRRDGVPYPAAPSLAIVLLSPDHPYQGQYIPWSLPTLPRVPRLKKKGSQVTDREENMAIF